MSTATPAHPSQVSDADVDIITTKCCIQGKDTSKSFYRRPLPEVCISFSSPEGRKLFSEALPQGTMECYFRIAEQFATQAEPAYCGLTTLSVVLNALALDPNRLWKGPWRWYSEDLLDCCKPLDKVQTEGIELREFCCLAWCNGANAESYRVPQTPPDATTTTTTTTTPATSSTSNPDQDQHHGGQHQGTDLFDHTQGDLSGNTLALFRQHIQEASRNASGDSFLVVNYDRGTLGQTGTGHFSPIGGYHAASDHVLVLDVARFKYPPYWVPVSLLYQSLFVPDTTSKQTRGWVLVSRPTLSRCALLCSLQYTRQSAPLSLAQVRDLFARMATDARRGHAEAADGSTLQEHICRWLQAIPASVTSEHISNGNGVDKRKKVVCGTLTEEHKEVVKGMVQALADSAVGRAVRAHLPPALEPTRVTTVPFLTVLFMALPRQYLRTLQVPDHIVQALEDDVDNATKTCPALKAELAQISYQITSTEVCATGKGCTKRHGTECCSAVTSEQPTAKRPKA